MTRIKRGVMTKKRHKKLLKQTKGFWGQRKNIFKRAKETLLRAMAFAFKGRKMRKRDMRSLFIMRIKAAAETNNTKYNILIHNLKNANVEINRKMLSQIAVYDPQVFSQIVEFVNH
ncbi:50S ribosomal protein L20 [Candidatus Babela massiliensis]|uniref:Large ribosomal subunit protein bL20 n=1 Tax=Candidatus Babela massiliensis TaxID=673862 RepID=V6DF84_9BACT|nr:50S ribosomal protein L20 [Candidatus Babela massiliensis]CDK30257.1 Ribosomal protein L20 [Candidatus Babela massiliensis]